MLFDETVPLVARRVNYDKGPFTSGDFVKAEIEIRPLPEPREAVWLVENVTRTEIIIETIRTISRTRDVTRFRRTKPFVIRPVAICADQFES